MRGALGTVDRPYHIFEWFHHDRFHVLHHMFLQIVFYHTDEATAAIKKKLGPLYKSDPTSFYEAMWQVPATADCHYVESVKVYSTTRACPIKTSKPAKV